MSRPQHRIAVIGLGYVGLPLASLCARKGYAVIGLDTNEAIVETLNQGQSPIQHGVAGRFVQHGLEGWVFWRTWFSTGGGRRHGEGSERGRDT